MSIIKEINKEGGQSDAGQIEPYKDQWYAFSVDDPDTVIVLIFEPNVNYYVDKFTGYKVQFYVYDSLPADVAASNHIGNGLNREGDVKNGRLVWAGPLTPGTRNYLRLVNDSPEEIDYCLATTDVYEWTCEDN